ncbi:hypothetical protein [Comamonas thiooxydans]|uniref:hypothetical protein n=1 Tax=Comamonas thiooxydans TaxID=363952 RepID=UPI0015565A05|nr:hypothetical protein [Comamonas thiooxydans]
MPIYKFKRTMQYTEEIEVEAADEAEGREKALCEDGVRNNDDRVVDLVKVK